MIGEHTDVNKHVTDLATKLKVTPGDNATSKSLKAEGKKNFDKLKGLKGNESHARTRFPPSHIRVQMSEISML